jgi:hypothetical protein
MEETIEIKVRNHKTEPWTIVRETLFRWAQRRHRGIADLQSRRRAPSSSRDDREGRRSDRSLQGPLSLVTNVPGETGCCFLADAALLTDAYTAGAENPTCPYFSGVRSISTERRQVAISTSFWL